MKPKEQKHYWQISFPFQVHAEEISGNNGYVELSFCAKKLDDKVSGAHRFNGNTNTVHILSDMV